MKRKVFSKVLGWGLTTGLIFASVAAIFAAPASAGEMEWTMTNTPSWEDFEILPDSDVIDYAVGAEDGSTVFAITGPKVSMESVAGGSAIWTEDATAPEGDYAALLTKNGGAADGSTFVEFAPQPGITVDNLMDLLNTWSFDYDMGTTTLAGPHLELRFDSPTAFGHVDITIM